MNELNGCFRLSNKDLKTAGHLHGFSAQYTRKGQKEAKEIVGSKSGEAKDHLMKFTYDWVDPRSDYFKTGT
jgi:hypothetical protein